MAAPVITHRKVSGKAQGPDLTRVYGNHWDDTHVITGLENVDNTSDANKPVSTATQAALDAKVTGPAGATDDLPAIFDGATGKLIKSKTYAAFKTLLALVKGDVGLGNVDNTSDANKPVSTAQQVAMREKLAAGRNLFVRTPAAPVTINIASPGNVAWPAHGLSANDPVVLAILPFKAAVTVTIASPGVVTWNAHGFAAGQPFKFATTNGALPTGITAGTTYFVIATGLTTNTFQFAATVGGAAINTTGTQSGSHFGLQTGTMPTGLVEGTVYYAKTIVDANNITVSATPGGAAINTTGSTNGKIYASTGNDSNSGLGNTRSTALLTLQKATDIALGSIDAQGQAVQINVADSTYTTPVALNYAQLAAYPAVLFVGNTTFPANCLVSPTSANAFTVQNGAHLYLTGFKLATTTLGDCINVSAFGMVEFQNVDFGTCAGIHISIQGFANCFARGNWTISGGATAHMHLPAEGYFDSGVGTCTLIGTPNFPNFFIGMRASYATFVLFTGFVGLATGPQGTIHYGATLDCETKSYRFIPGNTDTMTVRGGSSFISNAPLLQPGDTINLNLGNALVQLNDSIGSYALVMFNVTNVAAATVVSSPTANFVTGADPGAGSNKWWVQAGGSITNRFAGANSLIITPMTPTNF